MGMSCCRKPIGLLYRRPGLESRAHGLGSWTTSRHFHAPNLSSGGAWQFQLSASDSQYHQLWPKINLDKGGVGVSDRARHPETNGNHLGAVGQHWSLRRKKKVLVSERPDGPRVKRTGHSARRGRWTTAAKVIADAGHHRDAARK